MADEKTFSHPLNADWLARALPRDARILDYGCGYGRTLDALAGLGYARTVGVDFAPRMIARGRRCFPGLDLRVLDDARLAEPDGCFDAVLLFAVLTCIPEDAAQAALVTEAYRLLRPGGLLYVSDMELQTDARSLARCAASQARFGTYGVFETEDGAVVRHHAAGHLADLLAAFDRIETARIPVRTMNGHAATAVQIVARRPGGPAPTRADRYGPYMRIGSTPPARS